MKASPRKDALCGPTGASSLGAVRFPERRGLDYQRLRDVVAITAVLELLGWEPVSRRGPQLRGPCPVHGSQGPHSRTLSVNTAKNVFRCFKPECSAKGNQLDLYRAVTGLPLYEASLELCEKLGVEPPWLPPK